MDDFVAPYILKGLVSDGRDKFNEIFFSIQQMEKCFPWFNVKACQIWDKNQNFPP